MRRAVLVLLLAACATGTHPRLSIDVFETGRPRSHPASVLGMHLFRVQVTNLSGQTAAIESIHLDLMGMSDFELSDASQTVDAQLGPGQSESFSFAVTVSGSRATLQSRIDSLRVTVSGRGEAGGFVESDVVYVKPE